MPRVVLIASLLALAFSGSSAAPGTFPGVNGLLVFDGVDTSTKTVQLYRLAADGSGLKQLTQTAGAVWNEDPAWSSNGRTIFFDSVDRSRPAVPGHIYRINANGTARQLADLRSAPTHVWPSVKRNGSALVAVQFGKGAQGGSIVSMRSNGAGRRVVAGGTRLQNNGSPEYAPGGGRFVFSRVIYNKSGQGIARADLIVRNGRRNTNITRRSNAKYFSPSWAPSGKALVAVRGQRTIVTMKPNGTGIRVLTSVSGAETGVSTVVFSPNGRKLAYLQCKGDCGDPELAGQGSIWVMNANGSGKQAIFTGSAAAGQPAERLSWGAGS